MSLIESALDKLRRAEATAAESHRAAQSRTAGVTPLVPAPAPPPAVISENRPKISIDLQHVRAAGYLPEQSMERRFADHFRALKRPLIEKAISGTSEMRLIMVTSALPGDGKTFTSLNLAMSMARERDISVLLVDADGARARVSEVMKIRQQAGLLDALADDAVDVESLVARTDVRGLDVLPAGRFIENSTELIASGRMAQLAVRLTAHDPRRLVLMDSAPLLVSSDARALMRVAGQVALVVRAGATPRRAIQEAVAQVDKKKLQGLIVNQVAEGPGGDYYGYPPYEASPGSGSD
jgi:protein-tyrosine kinase